jgi:1-acyl-sn-glycerol-3-phosphate acyltransferase
MTVTFRLVNFMIKRIVRLLCRVDDSQWHKFPIEGPLIIAANHINFLDAPVMYTHLLPRPLSGFAKTETWDNPLTAWLFDLWGAIPLRRGEADVAAMRAGMKALAEGKFLAVAPEGTRSRDGTLGEGHPGIVILSLKKATPILPIAYYGMEHVWNNLRRLRRTDFHLRVGRPFRLDANGVRVTRSVRKQMVDEIMYQIAALLPPEYRGHYADLSASSETHLDFLE